MRKKALVLVLFAVLLMASNWGGLQSLNQKTFSPMSSQEAMQLIQERIQNGEVPRHPAKRLWDLPEHKLSAVGVKINNHDHLVFASVDVVTILDLEKGNLPQILPGLSFGEDIYPSPLGGLLLSTVDIEVANAILLSPGWKKESQIIEKGAYMWFVSEVGLCLSKSEEGTYRLICFETPIPNFSSSVKTRLQQRTPLRYEISLSTSKGAGELEVRVADRVIRLK